MDTKTSLDSMSAALRALHQALMHWERRRYEKMWGQVEPAQLLQLLTRHPEFAWLHTLSEFIVEIDELRDEADVDAATVKRIRDQAMQLITPAQTDTPFATRYGEALQGDPELVMAHVAAKQALAAA